MEAENAKVVLGLFTAYLDGDHDDDCESDEEVAPFCARSAPEKVVDGLDRFLRFTVMSELVLNLDQRQCIFVTIHEFCDWLGFDGLLSSKETAHLEKLRESHNEMWRHSYDAGLAIKTLSESSKPAGKSVETIEFDRHDVAKIDGDQIWMENWSSMILPKETTIGPIKLPKQNVDLLQVGWITNCELKKFKSGWQITDIGQMYPALPF